MPEHTTIATEYADAVGHPLRWRLIAALGDGPRTLESLASELDVSDATIMEHARTLEKLDLLKAVDHDDASRTYELRREPIIWETAWESLPTVARRSSAAAAITQMATTATAAVDRGGFDRGDIFVTRTSLRVDERRWRELTRLFGSALHTLGDMADEPAPDESAGPTFQATAVMWLFTGEGAERDPHLPSGRWDVDGALKRLWELSEDLEELGPQPETDWERVTEIAEELRMIAKSMRALDRAAPMHLAHE